MDRRDRLLSMFDSSGKGLEIGPSFNPLLPKAQGYDVEVLDHLDAAGLREKYRGAGVDLDAIEAVDHVSTGGSIAAAVGKASCFDFCIALHVIEHTVDLLGFLLDCETLLKPHGALVLAVPDKRYSFDMFRPLSSTGDVLQAHLQPDSRHAPGKVFDELAYNAVRGGKPAWEPGETGAFAFFHTIKDVKQVFDTIMAERVAEVGEFTDIHAWQFTPSSFRLVLSDLAAMDYTSLREDRFIDPGTGEFYVTLSRTGAGCPLPRIELAWQVMVEQARIVDTPAVDSCP